MKQAVLCIIAFAIAGVCQPAAAETFEEAWASRWRPQVQGSFLSRRFESQIKAACKEVWDTAQANMPAGESKPAAKATKATKSAFAAVGKPRRRLFRRIRRGE